jgi:dienelactone hydrolase
VPSNFLEEGATREVGLLLAHGDDAEGMRGPLLTRLAAHFARQGYVVARYYCRQKEQRRQRILERTADTAALSPYARTVRRWVWVGHANGARIATLVAAKNPRLQRAAFALLSYPLMEPAPPPPKQKAGAEPPADSLGPLMRLIESSKAPILFVSGELDCNCPGADLKAVGPALAAAGVDARAVILPDLDSQFAAPGAAGPGPQALEAVVGLVDRFVKAVEAGGVAACGLPGLDAIVPSTRVPPRPQRAVEEEPEEPEPAPVVVPAASAAPARPGPGAAPAMRPGMPFPPGMQFSPAAQQQMAMLLQQQMLAQRQAAGGGQPAGMLAQQQQAQLQVHLQMAMLQQQIAAAAAAGRVPVPQQQQQQQHGPPGS